MSVTRASARSSSASVMIASAIARSADDSGLNITTALYAAVLAAGFGVRDRDGSVMQTVQPGQGLAFRAGEVAAVAKMYGEGRIVDFVYLSGGLKSIPELKQAPLKVSSVVLSTQVQPVSLQTRLSPVPGVARL